MAKYRYTSTKIYYLLTYHLWTAYHLSTVIYKYNVAKIILIYI